ncbi:MAG: hypothetical protein PHC62_11500 [Candidatus Izemoplasmatales bacterium]|uniref:hypothetical protein n=1 Tax=Bacteroides sp. TaxID=29523 RepID=UPI0025813EA7|nr:hypothetical protein [Bacteroides sp.]MDD3040017.1 hypothetical protein [Bacteroides sp.]MDD3124113.1 hypothetical protein [Candidatus Izemoplasmatales bacterium]
MENQDLKISNVTTVMKVEKEVSGFKVSGTVEVYNNSKEIKKIDARIIASNEIDSMKSYNYSVNRYVSNPMEGISSSNEDSIPILAVGIEFEKLIEAAIAANQLNTI